MMGNNTQIGYVALGFPLPRAMPFFSILLYTHEPVATSGVQRRPVLPRIR